MTDIGPERSQDDPSELESALREAAANEVSATSRAHALTDRQASGLSARERATVIVLAGAVASGKTTLITALYERFGHGPIAGHRFAGSLTLPGFEARAR